MQELNPVAERLITAVMNEMFDEDGRLTLGREEAARYCVPYCAVLCLEL